MISKIGIRWVLLVLFGAAIFAAQQSNAEEGVGQDLDFAALMNDWFDPKEPFAAVADVEVMDASFPVKMTIQFYGQDGVFRTEMDMAKMQSAIMPEGALNKAQELGLDRIVTIAFSQQNKSVVLYPGRKAYHEKRLTRKTGINTSDIEKVADGEEFVNGRLCWRERAYLGSNRNPADGFTLWRAKDLKNFPVKIDVGSKMRLTFRDVKLGPQEPTLFQVPGDYTAFESVKDVTAAALGRSVDPSASLAAEALAKRKEKMSLADQKALEFQIKRAGEGSAMAQYDLGLRYWEGRGVVKDVGQAYMFMEQAAAGGNNQAKAFLTRHPKPTPKVIEAPQQGAPEKPAEKPKQNKKRKPSSKKKSNKKK